MEIEVLLFGKFREIAGTKQQVLTVQEGARLSDVLGQLGEIYGSGFGAEVKRRGWVRILINGREYGLLDGMETLLKHNDQIVILPTIGGG
jgi:molybdopterin converting factor small subunit